MAPRKPPAAAHTGVVVCTTDHDSDAIGHTVPAGSLWDGDHPVVTANPAAFQPAPVDTPEDTPAGEE